MGFFTPWTSKLATAGAGWRWGWPERSNPVWKPIVGIVLAILFGLGLAKLIQVMVAIAAAGVLHSIGM